MLDIQNGIRSLTEFKQNSTNILSYIKETHNPTVLTVNGKAEAVLLDPETYQNMVKKISLLNDSKNIQMSLIEMENDDGIPAEEIFKKLHEKFTK
jgi:PHD/YefM family antitoxin component YafN of YafNO toxin-antitoxin module